MTNTLLGIIVGMSIVCDALFFAIWKYDVERQQGLTTQPSVIEKYTILGMALSTFTVISGILCILGQR